ncbi:unnamed protein product, partial [Tilletia caries]
MLSSVKRLPDWDLPPDIQCHGCSLRYRGHHWAYHRGALKSKASWRWCFWLNLFFIPFPHRRGITYAWDDSRIIDLIIGFVVIGLAFCADQVYQGERATIPLRILKNRTVGFGSLVKFCVAAAYVSLLYFLPIYFQSVQRSSAIRSGVQTLPLIMAVIVFMTATGIMVSSLQVPPWCRSAAVCYTCSGRTFPKQHGLAFSYSRVLDLVWHG